MRYFCISVFLFFCFSITLHVAAEDQYNVLELMKDAKPIEQRYFVDAIINTPYKVVSVVPYYYSSSSEKLIELPKIAKIYNNHLSFEFYQSLEKSPYLFLHIVYGPDFVMERNSEGVCYVPIKSAVILNQIPCNTETTAKYLLSLSLVDDVKNKALFSKDLIKKWFELNRLPQTQSWQNYQAILVFLLSHVSQKPEYVKVNLPSKYLESMGRIVIDLNHKFLLRKRLLLNDFENILQKEDKSLVNIGYLILSSFDSLKEQHSKQLSFVNEHPAYLEDFFSGLASFTLSDPESMSVPNIKVKDDFVYFERWPWITKVTYAVDDSDYKEVIGNKIKFGLDAVNIHIKPYGLKGRFLSSVVQVGLDNESKR